MSDWIGSSAMRAPKAIPAKRHMASSKKSNVKHKKVIEEGGSWATVFEPTSKEELAVHKKKLEEVDGWMKRSTKPCTHGKAPILLIVGPTGCGKSVTLKILSQEHGISVREWSHPLTVDYTDYDGDSWKYTGVNEVRREKIVDVFDEFLFTTSRYKSLFEDKSTGLVLLEDIPSVFNKHIEDFHECLKKYRAYGRCPLVVLLCETSTNKEFKLFPPDLKVQLGIETITFNPVALTLVSKALNKIVADASKEYGRVFSRPTDVQMEGISHGCSGDLRLAVNLLEVTCLGSSSKGVAEFNTKKAATVKKKVATKDTKATGSLKDSSLYIFHALGKILYCKREEKIIHNLPPHLKTFERPPTQANPEEVFDRTCVSQDLFVRMLHNNASNFYASIDTAFNCLDYFSMGDYVSSVWDTASTMSSLSLSVTLRGLMFNLEKIPGKSHFGTFKKPSYDWRKVNSRMENAMDAFRMSGASSEELVTDVLPYCFHIRPPHLSQTQWDVVNDCVLVRKVFGGGGGLDMTLREKDLVEEDDTVERRVEERDEVVTREEEETVIEEVDSD